MQCWEVAPLKTTEKCFLGLSHFGVDFVCTALLTALSGSLSPWQVIALSIVYNGLAFAFQLPMGALADKLGWGRGLVLWGCILVAAGAWLPGAWGVCILIGLGNACFHVGGGREVLQRSGGRAGAVGHFVAPGALGIFLGPRAVGCLWLTRGLIPLGLLFLAGCIFRSSPGPAPADLPTRSLSPRRQAGVLACMFLTVLLRSYMGTVLEYPFLGSILPAFAFSLCIFGGKFFGGSLADRFGSLSFSAAAQGLCIVLFLLSAWAPLLAMPAIFLFNTTMAVTATQLYRAMPQYPGTMFGLTTFSLFLGVLPRLLEWGNPFFCWWGLGLLSLLSAASLLAGLALQKGGDGVDSPSAFSGTFPGPHTAS